MRCSPVRSAFVTGAEALTAGERLVADLAAAGMTNREIAQALFITTKTVAFHLTHAYRKLDIGSRDELAQALAESGPTTGAGGNRGARI
jgi:DNA-binding CsgD family transcriptional regulator